MTKKELSQLYYLNREIEQQKRRLQELEAVATGCTTQITGMPHGSMVGDKVSKYAAEIADLKGLIELNIQKCWYELNRLNRYIASVDDPLMRQILSYRFVNGLAWEQVAENIGTNENAVKQACSRFLRRSESCHTCHA